MYKINYKTLKVLPLLLTFNILLFTCFSVFSQGAAINTSGAVADPSAMLDVSSTNAGILIPRMTEAQKNSIAAPTVGLMIYQTDATAGFWYYDGAVWVQSIGVAGSIGATGATGADGATGATGFLSPGSATGNTPYWDGSQWVVNSSNIFNNGGSVGIGTSSPDNSAILDLYSSSKGIAIPRMTDIERNLISNPTEGLQIYNTTSKCIEFYADGEWFKLNCAYKFNCETESVSFVYRNNQVVYGTVKGDYNSGQYCWLDRNLGASAVATAYSDANAFGDLFQWGRLDDGHQLRSNNSSTTTQSVNVNPGHSSFIKGSSNWYSGSNPDLLWQGVSGINNPCPIGWRLPTRMELVDENSTWSSNNYIGAFDSKLKLTAGGYRDTTTGELKSVGSYGRYWSSTVYIDASYYLTYGGSSASITYFSRARGVSVRCIKDY